MTSIDSRRLIDNMERITPSELASNFDTYYERMTRDDVGFILTEDGIDKYVIFPYHWCLSEGEMIQIEVEKELYDKVSELIAPMRISHEELISAFFEWCVNPATQNEAMMWLKEVSAH